MLVMDRKREPELLRRIIVQTGIMLIIAAILLVILYLWLFKRLLS
jgi:hypothetical protein